MTKDKYDHAIDYLRRHPKSIKIAWDRPYQHVAGCLFKLACAHPGWGPGEMRQCEHGCLTEIRAGLLSVNEALTRAIAGDARLPDNKDAIRLHHLPVFAEWQRRLDQELHR